MNGIIVHTLIKDREGRALIIKRNKYREGGRINAQPEKWDFPGGTVEKRELPRDAAKREIEEETSLNVNIKGIIHEESNYDSKKDKVFTTLVYFGELVGEMDVKLNPEEHSEFMFIESIGASINY